MGGSQRRRQWRMQFIQRATCCHGKGSEDEERRGSSSGCNDAAMQRDTMQQGTARYGTVRSPMTEWHGSSSILSSLLSSPRRANTHRTPGECVWMHARPCVLRCTANLSPFECEAWIFPAALFAGINSPYFEDDIRAVTGEWFSQAKPGVIDVFNSARLPDRSMGIKNNSSCLVSSDVLLLLAASGCSRAIGKLSF